MESTEKSNQSWTSKNSLKSYYKCSPQNNIRFIDNWKKIWGRSDLLKRDVIHPSWDGGAFLSSNMAQSLRARTGIGAQVRKQTDWLNLRSGHWAQINPIT